MRKLILGISFFTILLLISGCNGYTQKDMSLSQNWDKEDQKEFYQTSQGSQIIKYAWFMALKRADKPDLYFKDNFERFGYLTDPFAPSTDSKRGYNPDALSIGFVKDIDKDKKQWIGMTCAACHTNEMIIGGKPHLIDGAPTDADFYKFIKELSETLTVANGSGFDIFASEVQKQSEERSWDFNKEDLREELSVEAPRFAKFLKRSKPDKDKPWGKARLDAVGLIINELAHRMNPIKENLETPNSPVSYPFVWDTHQQARIQWNGVSTGSLSRNTTEVLGVFARFNPEKLSDNSVQLGNLKDLEKLVTSLRSPRWTEKRFGLKVDMNPDRKIRAAKLYEKHCQSCHKVFDREEEQVDDVTIVLNPIRQGIPTPRNIPDTITDDRPINTDPIMADSFNTRRIKVDVDGEFIPVQAALGKVLPGIWLKSFFGALVVGGLQAAIGEDVKELRVYKARPLNGVWATAPFLHNGSIPNMMELLKPAAERVKSFCVGSRVFDEKNMGFESGLTYSGDKVVKGPMKKEDCGNEFWLDTSVAGNSNAGHEDYGNKPLTEQERRDIIEFIKSE